MNAAKASCSSLGSFAVSVITFSSNFPMALEVYLATLTRCAFASQYLSSHTAIRAWRQLKVAWESLLIGTRRVFREALRLPLSRPNDCRISCNAASHGNQAGGRT